MRQVNVRDFQEQFGDFLVLARDEPVAVSKFGMPVAVLMSVEEFTHLQALEDLYWIDRAAAVEVTGEWIDHEEAVALLGIPSSLTIKRRLMIHKMVLEELLTLQPDQLRHIAVFLECLYAFDLKRQLARQLGDSGFWRIAVVGYRIIYCFDDAYLYVVAAGTRSEGG